MRKLYFFIFLFYFSISVRSQSSNNLLSPEDSAFNSVYYKRSIPRVKGKLINISDDERKKISISYTVVTPLSQFQIKKTAIAPFI
jgi:hypothetical protein